jgi:hypothetical protein
MPHQLPRITFKSRSGTAFVVAKRVRPHEVPVARRDTTLRAKQNENESDFKEGPPNVADNE